MDWKVIEPYVTKFVYIVGVIGTIYGSFQFLKRVFLKVAFAYQLLITVVLLFASFGFFIHYFRLLQNYAEFMEKAISVELMNNDQSYRTVEAYVLSNINQTPIGSISSDREIKEAINSYKNDLIKLEEIYSVKEKSVQFEKVIEQWEQLGKSRNDDLVWIPESHDRRSGFLTGKDSLPYLFNPGFSLQGATIFKEFPYKTLNNNIDIEFQILAGYLADSLFNAFLDNTITIDGCKVVQTFFVSDIGTLTVKGKLNNRDYRSYYNAFKSRTYFPDKRYFWKSFEKEKEYNIFDYASMPYIDYGGNGLIRTYSLKIDLPGGRKGIIGIDCSLSETSSMAMNANIKSLNNSQNPGVLGILSDGNFTIKDTINCIGFESVVEQVINNRELRERVTREITLHHDQNDTSSLIFSIPTLWVSEKNQTISKVNLVRVDTKIVQKGIWEIITGILCLALSISCVVVIINKYYYTGQELEDLLFRFSNVMEDSEIPFAIFNQKGEFESVNKAWIEMLGYDNEDDMMYRSKARSIKRRFTDLLVSEEDRRTYKAVIEKSSKGEHTDAERWTLKKKAKPGVEENVFELIRVKTHAEGVVIRRMLQPDLLQRFGIVLEKVPLKDRNH